MIKIAVCDDNLDIANFIKKTIQHINKENFSCDVYQSGKELIRNLQTVQFPYNVYFMDIQMPRQSGIETAAMIRSSDRDALIIFITDYNEYVFDVFEVLPFRFLQKPVSAETLTRTIKDAAAQIHLYGQIFFFRIGRETYQMPCREIIYFESAGRKVTLRTKRQSYEFYDKISNIAVRIDNGIFCRIHTSYLINLEFVRSIKHTEIFLEDGTILPISKKYHNAVRQAHLAFLERRCGI